jgi:hypothetical protein
LVCYRLILVIWYWFRFECYNFVAQHSKVLSPKFEKVRIFWGSCLSSLQLNSPPTLRRVTTWWTGLLWIKRFLVMIQPSTSFFFA